MPDLGKLKAWATAPGAQSSSGLYVGHRHRLVRQRRRRQDRRVGVTREDRFRQLRLRRRLLHRRLRQADGRGSQGHRRLHRRTRRCCSSVRGRERRDDRQRHRSVRGENLATLGIVAGIAVLVAGIIYLATHWHQVWTDIKNWVLDAWHFIDNIFHDGIIGPSCPSPSP